MGKSGAPAPAFADMSRPNSNVASRVHGWFAMLDADSSGGLLTLNSFVTTFPQIDTTKAGEMGLSAAEKSSRSTVQGTTPHSIQSVPIY